ncbi:protein FAM43B-like [Gastrophryne carolinensis]
MLPWRRRTCVLAEKEEEKRGKCLGWSSLLPPFGSVFSPRRQTVELNREHPSYTAWYLGNAITLHAKGEGAAAEVVGKIWEKSESGGYSTKMKLSLGTYGIRMSQRRGGDAARQTVHTYLLHRITYCAPDPGHPKVFCWVYRHQVKNKAVVLRCHAVLVSRSEKARALARSLAQISLATFSEFKRLKRQSDFRRERREMLGERVVPAVPLRKLLKGACSYNAPAERSKSAPWLSSILEEEEEDKGAAHRTTIRVGAHHRDAILEENKGAAHRTTIRVGARPPDRDAILEENKGTAHRTTIRVGARPPDRDAILEENKGAAHRTTNRVGAHHRDSILELAQELRRLSVHRALAKRGTYPPPAHLPDWRRPIRTFC